MVRRKEKGRNTGAGHNTAKQIGALMIDLNAMQDHVTEIECVDEFGASVGLVTRSTATLNHTFCNMYIVYNNLAGESCMYETTRFSANDPFVLTECLYELAMHVDVPSLAIRLRGMADAFNCVLVS